MATQILCLLSMGDCFLKINLFFLAWSKTETQIQNVIFVEENIFGSNKFKLTVKKYNNKNINKYEQLVFFNDK